MGIRRANRAYRGLQVVQAMLFFVWGLQALLSLNGPGSLGLPWGGAESGPRQDSFVPEGQRFLLEGGEEEMLACSYDGPPPPPPPEGARARPLI